VNDGIARTTRLMRTTPSRLRGKIRDLKHILWSLHRRRSNVKLRE